MLLFCNSFKANHDSVEKRMGRLSGNSRKSLFVSTYCSTLCQKAKGKALPTVTASTSVQNVSFLSSGKVNVLFIEFCSH